MEVFRLNGRLLAAGTVSQIARAMGLTRQSVQRIADRLDEEGLVAYADNPAHRRAKLLALTTRGRSVLNAITERQITWANALGARVGEAQLRRAAEFLRSVRDTLERDVASRRRERSARPTARREKRHAKVRRAR